MRYVASYFFVAIFGVCSVAQGQDGSFDTSFASTGKKAFNISPSQDDLGIVVRETAYGKLLMAGNCDSVLCLAQLNPDGSLDQSYGPTQLGYFRLDLVGVTGENAANDMILLPDGRAAVLACIGGHSYAIFIVKADGSDLDRTLVNGQGYSTFSAASCASSLRRQTDGMFDVALAHQVAGYGPDMAVQRVLSDLSGLDTSFGVNGTADIAFGLNGTTGDDFPNAMVIQSDGKIVVGGAGYKGEATVLEAARLLPNGHLDTTFGNSDGRLHYPGSSTETGVLDLAIDSEQRIVFGGFIHESGTNERLVGRLTSSGQFDATFGTTGLAEFPFANAGDSQVTSVVPSGQSIIVGAFVPTNASTTNFSVSRIDNSGHLVASFGGSGTIYNYFSLSPSTSATGNAIVTSRGIVVAGYSISNSIAQFGIARLNYDYLFSDSFE